MPAGSTRTTRAVPWTTHLPRVELQRQHLARAVLRSLEPDEHPALADVARAGGEELLDGGEAQVDPELDACALMAAALFRIVGHAGILREEGVHRVCHARNPAELQGRAEGARSVALRQQASREPELRGFGEALVELADRPHLAGEADLAEDQRPGG